MRCIDTSPADIPDDLTPLPDHVEGPCATCGQLVAWGGQGAYLYHINGRNDHPPERTA